MSKNGNFNRNNDCHSEVNKEKETKTYSILSSEFKSTFVNTKPFSSYNYRKTLSERRKSDISDGAPKKPLPTTYYGDIKLSTTPELLQIQDILRGDRVLKQQKSFSRQQRKEKFDSLHSEFLSEKFKSYKSLFLTTKKDNGDDTDRDSLAKNLIPNLKHTKKATIDTEVKHKTMASKRNSTANFSVSGFKEKQYVFKPGQISRVHYEGLREFVENTNTNSRMRLALKIKEEQYVREGETYANKVEAIKDEYFHMRRTKEVFEKEFLGNYEAWLRFLDKEKEDLRNLKEIQTKQKHEIEAEIRQFENKLTRMKEKLQLYKEYRIFLVCVKEKRFNLFSHNQQLERNSTKIPLKRLKQSDSLVNFKRANLLVHESAFSSMQNVILEKYGKQIYEFPQQVVDEFKLLQAENLKKMEEFNELSLKIKAQSSQLEQDFDEKENLYMQDRIKEKEKHLERLKKKNKFLIGEREKLRTDFSTNTHRRNVNTLKSKINEIYHTCKEQQVIQLSKRQPTLSNLNIQIKHPELANLLESKISEFDKLSFIERVIVIITTRYRYFQQNNIEDIKDYEKEKEQERKRKQAFDQRAEILQKRQKMLNKVLEKYNKFYSIPRRKVAERMRPKDDNHVFYKKREETLGLEDFINYEGNDELF